MIAFVLLAAHCCLPAAARALHDASFSTSMSAASANEHEASVDLFTMTHGNGAADARGMAMGDDVQTGGLATSASQGHGVAASDFSGDAEIDNNAATADFDAHGFADNGGMATSGGGALARGVNGYAGTGGYVAADAGPDGSATSGATGSASADEYGTSADTTTVTTTDGDAMASADAAAIAGTEGDPCDGEYGKFCIGGDDGQKTGDDYNSDKEEVYTGGKEEESDGGKEEESNVDKEEESEDGGESCGKEHCYPPSYHGPSYDDKKEYASQIQTTSEATAYAISYGEACKLYGVSEARSYAYATVDIDIDFYTIVEGECYAVAEEELEPRYAAEAACYAIEYTKSSPETYSSYYSSYGGYSAEHPYYCVADSYGKVYSSGYESASASAEVLANMYNTYSSYDVSVEEVSYVCAQSLSVAVEEGVACEEIGKLLALMLEIASAAGAEEYLIEAIAELEGVTECLLTEDAEAYLSDVSGSEALYEYLGGSAESGDYDYSSNEASAEECIEC